jgi:L-methionine (R)-S-oxide reductase
MGTVDRNCSRRSSICRRGAVAGILSRGVVRLISERLPRYDWVGFYMLDPRDPEMLAPCPFVGEPSQHVRIPVHQGICGAAVASRATTVQREGHCLAR